MFKSYWSKWYVEQILADPESYPADFWYEAMRRLLAERAPA